MMMPQTGYIIGGVLIGCVIIGVFANMENNPPQPEVKCPVCEKCPEVRKSDALTPEEVVGQIQRCRALGLHPNTLYNNGGTGQLVEIQCIPLEDKPR